MKRGILELTRTEFNALIKGVNLENFNNSTIKGKLLSAQTATEEIVRLEVSEEELEIMADEVGMPFADDNIDLKNARDKIGDMILGFRSVI